MDLIFFGPNILDVEAPIGIPCDWCGENILATEWGIIVPGIEEDDVCLAVEDKVYHNECGYRFKRGSVGHITRQCPCFGGTEEDPPNTTKRQAALLAFMVAYSMSRNEGKA